MRKNIYWKEDITSLCYPDKSLPNLLLLSNDGEVTQQVQMPPISMGLRFSGYMTYLGKNRYLLICLQNRY